MVATGKTTITKAPAALAMAAFLAAALLVGCSPGASSGAASSAAPSPASSASAASSESASPSGSAGSDASAGSSGSFSAETASAVGSDSASASASSSDFDRMLVGAWRIYSLEYGGYSKTKIGSDEISFLRDLGLFETITLFADGSYQLNHGRAYLYDNTWEESGYNEIVLHEVLEKSSDTGKYQDATATISSGRMTIEFDDQKYKHVKLVYSKQ